MVYLIDHTTGTKWKTQDVQRARKIINERLPEYQDYEARLVRHVLDLDLEDSPPTVFTYSIVVDDVVVWTNNNLF